MCQFLKHIFTSFTRKGYCIFGSGNQVLRTGRLPEHALCIVDNHHVTKVGREGIGRRVQHSLEKRSSLYFWHLIGFFLNSTMTENFTEFNIHCHPIISSFKHKVPYRPIHLHQKVVEIAWQRWTYKGRVVHQLGKSVASEKKRNHL